MFSKPFSLNLTDLGKGLLVAVGAAVFAKLASATGAPGFDFVSYDWHSLISIAVSAGTMYLLKNFTQDANGTMFGKAR